MKLVFAVSACALVVLLASCGTTKKMMPAYLQDVQDTTGKGVVHYPEPLIQKNDLLSIQVYSASVDPQTDVPYNLPNLGGTAGSSSTGSSVSGFLVDQSGNIEYPRIGSIHVEGLTKQELAALIKQKFEGQLNQPSVIIRFLNYKITVLGEVGHPSSFNVPGERVTIFDALGMAGDITPAGVKTKVKVIRETNGDREIGTIDLTSGKLFASPFYVLQQNDVVVVESSGQREKQEEQQVTFRKVSLTLSIITAAALLYNIFK